MRVVALLAAVAVLGGLWLGVVTAAPLPQGGRQPLHRAVAALVGGEAPRPALRGGTVLIGRYLRPVPGGGLVATAGGRTVEVRLAPGSRAPLRVPRPGDRVLAFGRTVGEGEGAVFEARAVFLRRGLGATATGGRL